VGVEVVVTFVVVGVVEDTVGVVLIVVCVVVWRVVDVVVELPQDDKTSAVNMRKVSAIQITLLFKFPSFLLENIWNINCIVVSEMFYSIQNT
jgi:hypothetical protein